jgi:hypothetical protein
MAQSAADAPRCRGRPLCVIPEDDFAETFLIQIGIREKSIGFARTPAGADRNGQAPSAIVVYRRLKIAGLSETIADHRNILEEKHRH